MSQADLYLTRRQPNQRSSDRNAVDLAVPFSTVSGRKNLVQAILNRLHTRQGELAEIGHPDYGSRLYELVGELNNDRTRRRAELYIRQCLAQEARIDEVLEVSFEPPRRDLGLQTTLAAQVILRPVDDLSHLVLNITLAL